MPKELVVWKNVTVDFEGRQVKGSYCVDEEVVTVNSPRGRKSTQRGNSTAPLIAKMLLRELAKAGKA